jgi:hypothetical protein
LAKTLFEGLGLVDAPEIIDAIDSIKHDIDLTNTVQIGRFGAIEISKHDIGHKHNDAVGDISGSISGLVGALEAADPTLAMKRQKSGLVSRFFGQDAGAL